MCEVSDGHAEQNKYLEITFLVQAMVHQKEVGWWADHYVEDEDDGVPEHSFFLGFVSVGIRFNNFGIVYSIRQARMAQSQK